MCCGFFMYLKMSVSITISLRITFLSCLPYLLIFAVTVQQSRYIPLRQLSSGNLSLIGGKVILFYSCHQVALR